MTSKYFPGVEDEVFYLITLERSDGTTPKLVKSSERIFFTYEEAEKCLQEYPENIRSSYKIRVAIAEIGPQVSGEVFAIKTERVDWQVSKVEIIYQSDQPDFPVES